jgi:hypothetical protein
MMATAISFASCGNSASSVFHPSDPSFRPSPGPKPPVYLLRNLAEVPRVQMRSVGLIEVTVAERRGNTAAAEVAAEQGRELGCWIVVEHGAFTSLQTRASRDHDARVLLVHSGASHISHASPRARHTVQFDCVLQVTSSISCSFPLSNTLIQRARPIDSISRARTARPSASATT